MFCIIVSYYSEGIVKIKFKKLYQGEKKTPFAI